MTFELQAGLEPLLPGPLLLHWALRKLPALHLSKVAQARGTWDQGAKRCPDTVKAGTAGTRQKRNLISHMSLRHRKGAEKLS